MRPLVASTLALALSLGAAAAGDAKGREQLPPASFVGADDTAASERYVIGALDQLNVFVWRNADLGGKVQVRPDGMITTPLIPDLQAAGKTPAQLADDIRHALTKYVDDPRVTVMVETFQGSFSQQIRVVGATEKPASLPYRANMTLLDAMIAVGGLSEFASGNRAKLIRFDKTVGRQREYALRLGDLLKNGESRANVMLAPGDVIIIPESMF